MVPRRSVWRPKWKSLILRRPSLAMRPEDNHSSPVDGFHPRQRTRPAIWSVSSMTVRAPDSSLHAIGVPAQDRISDRHRTYISILLQSASNYWLSDVGSLSGADSSPRAALRRNGVMVHGVHGHFGSPVQAAEFTGIRVHVTQRKVTARDVEPDAMTLL